MANPPGALGALSIAHRRRLREVWRSAGWPCQDMVELDLVAAGLLNRERDSHGRDCLRLTDAGVQRLAASRAGHQAARSAHEALVSRVALDMHRAGRVVWCGLSLRAPLARDPASPTDDMAPSVPLLAGETPGLWSADGADIDADANDAHRPATAGSPAAHRWAMAMPDVFSIRHTTREDRVHPVVHEVKVHRSDLLADLKRPAKGEAYRALSSECWYVLREGIGDPGDIPDLYGVMVARLLDGDTADDGAAAAPAGPRFGALTVLRPAPQRPFAPPFALWMALARAAPQRFDDELAAQQPLGRPDSAA